MRAPRAPRKGMPRSARIFWPVTRCQLYRHRGSYVTSASRAGNTPLPARKWLRLWYGALSLRRAGASVRLDYAIGACALLSVLTAARTFAQETPAPTADDATSPVTEAPATPS